VPQSPGSESAAGHPNFAHTAADWPARTASRDSASEPTNRPGAAILRRAGTFLNWLAPWLVVGWTAGAIGMLLRALGGLAVVHRLRSTTTCRGDAPIQATADQLRQRAGIGRRVDVFKSTRIPSPLVIGAIRPVILLPASLLSGLSPRQIEGILAHELIHIRGHDYAVNLTQSIIEALLFYHPATWWIGRRIRRERENRCDDLAIAVTRDRPTYVRALAAIAAWRTPPLAAAASGGSIAARIRRLVRPAHTDAACASRRLGGLVAPIVAVGLIACAFVAGSYVRECEAAGESIDPVNAPPQAHSADETSPRAQGTVSGTLVDPEGNSVAGAAVLMQGFDYDRMKSIVLARAMSASDGRFVLGPVDARYRIHDEIVVQAAGFAIRDIASDLQGDATYSIFPGGNCDLRRIRLDRGRVFAGRVLDIDGRPLAGVEVKCEVLRFTAAYGAGSIVPELTLKTDTQGRIRTPPLPVGSLSLTVRVPGRLFAGWGLQAISPGAGEEVLKPCRLQPDVPISGILQDEQGRPIVGARVDADDVCETTSDASGKFVIDGFGPNPQFQLQIRKSGFVLINWAVKGTENGFRYQEAGPDVITYPNGPLKDLKVIMKRPGWIEGRAIDAQTGRLVRVDKLVLCYFVRRPGGEVVLSGCRFAEFEQPQPGHFRVSYSTPDEFHLTVSAAGYEDGEAFTPKVTRLEAITGIVVKMQKRPSGASPVVAPQRIAGTVRRDGKPVKTGWVGLWHLRPPIESINGALMRGRTVEQDPIIYASAPIRDGAYAIDVPFQDEAWYLMAEEPGQTMTQVGPLPVALDEHKKLDIACVEGGSISGEIRGVPKDWAGQLWVVAFTKTGIRTEARIGSDGRFNFTQLPPGEYGLKVGHDAYQDSEVPKGPVIPKDYGQKLADPWKRATVVHVEAGGVVSGVSLELPRE